MLEIVRLNELLVQIYLNVIEADGRQTTKLDRFFSADGKQQQQTTKMVGFELNG